jgi:ABC-2 type transport system ATP-binding protein
MGHAAVEVRHLTKVFKRPLPRLRRLLKRPGPDEVTALRDVSIDIEEGEIFGLVGRNGQGKTTLVKSIAALIIPTSGSINAFGFDSMRDSREVKRRIGLVSSDERSFYWRLTGWQNMMFFASLYGMDADPASRRIGELFETFDLVDLGHRPFNEYSNGIKQRLALVRALLTDPPLMLLDEPTRSLDPIAAEDLRRLILDRIASTERKTVLITSHNLAEVEQLCGRVAILSRNAVRECATLDELRVRYSAREEVRICVRGAPPAGALDRLGMRIEGLEAEKLPQDEHEIRFMRISGDGTLHAAMQEALAMGVEIVSCSTRSLGLKEILETIEQEEARP